MEVNCPKCLGSQFKNGDEVLQIYGAPNYGERVYRSEPLKIENEWEGSYSDGVQHRGMFVSSGKHLDACDLVLINQIPEEVSIKP